MYRHSYSVAAVESENGSPSGFELPRLLDFLFGSFEAHDIDSLVTNCIEFYLSNAETGQLDLCQLGVGLRETIRVEVEGNKTPVGLLLARFEQTAGGRLGRRLAQVAEHYLEGTRYMLPYIHAFAEATARLRNGAEAPAEVYLFLRDGISFWPAFDALRAGGSVNFALYSRAQAEAGLPPEIFSQRGGGFTKDDAPFTKNGLLIDVGLYGTLLSRLLERGFCGKTVGALFFSSRTPFIAGWLNNVIGNATLACGDLQYELLDIIRMADTLESLLKPFRIAHDAESPTGFTLRLTDLISFVCSAAFLRESHLYSRRRLREGAAETLPNLREVKENPESWFIRDPVRRWEGADEFVNGWSHGLLYPQTLLSGFVI